METVTRNGIIGVGQPFPAFEKSATVSIENGKEFASISSEDHKKDGKWMVMFWYPKDFTFVCPTEIAEFNNQHGEFRDRDAVLYGASTDTEFVHLAWRNNHDDLRGLKFPLIADTSDVELDQALAGHIEVITGYQDRVLYPIQ